MKLHMVCTMYVVDTLCLWQFKNLYLAYAFPPPKEVYCTVHSRRCELCTRRMNSSNFNFLIALSLFLNRRRPQSTRCYSSTCNASLLCLGFYHKHLHWSSCESNQDITGLTSKRRICQVKIHTPSSLPQRKRRTKQFVHSSTSAQRSSLFLFCVSSTLESKHQCLYMILGRGRLISLL